MAPCTHLHSLDLCHSSSLPKNQHFDSFTFNNPLCEGCKLTIFENIHYKCKLCNFHFHSSCAQFPSTMFHPSHPLHTLRLRPTAAYNGGQFTCDACNRTGNGFSYHCSTCEFDLHVECASKPLMIKHERHSSCMLELTFVKNPYGHGKGFSCNVCGKIGVKEWMYRCSGCEFDVHLACTESRNVFGDVQRLSHLYTPSPVSVLNNRPYSGLTGYNHELVQFQGPNNHPYLLAPNVTPTGSVQNMTQPQPETAVNNVINVVIQPNVTPTGSVQNMTQPQPETAVNNVINVVIEPNVTPTGSVQNMIQHSEPESAVNNVNNVVIEPVVVPTGSVQKMIHQPQPASAVNNVNNVVSRVPGSVNNPVLGNGARARDNFGEIDAPLDLENMFWDFPPPEI